MKQKLTVSQQIVYNCIVKYMKDCTRRRAPSIREICFLADLRSSSTVHAHLQTLKRKGYIDYEPGVPRSIKLL